MCVDCIVENVTCGDEIAAYCKGLIYYRDACVPCFQYGDPCHEASECCVNLGLSCYNGMCQPCTVQNADYGEHTPDYCTGLTCYDGTCQNCTVENETCTDAEDAVPCCGSLTCFKGTCQNCTAEDDICVDDIQPCCGDDLTYFNETCQSALGC